MNTRLANLFKRRFESIQGTSHFFGSIIKTLRALFLCLTRLRGIRPLDQLMLHEI